MVKREDEEGILEGDKADGRTRLENRRSGSRKRGTLKRRKKA
jgi:hypothetical protein